MAVQIKRFADSKIIDAKDFLAAEEPLEIRITFLANGMRKEKNISITMRSPGNDNELAVGFLFTEGIISKADQISSIVSQENVITISLKEDVNFDLTKLERNFYTTSSCGVCGKSSIDAIKTERHFDSSDTF